MKTFFTADPHFGHARIIELCDRPFKSVGHMNDELVRRFNSVASRARLVILGDICMGKLEDSLALLNRLEFEELVLVPGNHDRWSMAFHHKGDAEAKRQTWVERYAAVDSRIKVIEDTEPSYFQLRNLVPEMTPEHPLAWVLFSHYPYKGDSQVGSDDRYDTLRAPDDGLPIVHGHVHTEWQVRGRQFNVGVDVNDFLPVSEDTLSDWVAAL